MADIAVDCEGDVIAGLDGDCLGRRGAGVLLKAGHLLRGDVRDGAMRPVVGSETDCFILSREDAIDLGSWEGVLGVLAPVLEAWGR